MNGEIATSAERLHILSPEEDSCQQNLIPRIFDSFSREGKHEWRGSNDMVNNSRVATRLILTHNSAGVRG